MTEDKKKKQKFQMNWNNEKGEELTSHMISGFNDSSLPCHLFVAQDFLRFEKC